MLCIGSRTAACIKTDGAAILGKFHGIVQDIDQNFPDTDGFRHDIGILQRFTMHFKVQFPVQKHPLHDLDHTVCNCGDIRRNRGKLHLSALDAAQIQHIIQQGQQMIRAFLDLLQTVVHFRHRILMQCNICKADDGVHRGADVVGHIGKECAFGFAGCLRLLCKDSHFFRFLLGCKL